MCPGYELAAGGKGANQATAAARAGAVRMIGHVGDDSFGALRARPWPRPASTAPRSPLRRATGVAVIGVDQGAENQIIVASGANLDTDAGQVADRELAAGVTVLCQNEVRPEATFALIERAKEGGARTILNLAPAGAVPPQVLSMLDVLVVNKIEGRMAAGCASGAEVAAFARDLATTHDLTCVVTLGAAGALAIGPQSACGAGALPVDPVDTTGAGDAFVGVLAASLDLGHEFGAAQAARERRGGPGLHQARRAGQPAQGGADRGAARGPRASRPAGLRAGQSPHPRRGFPTKRGSRAQACSGLAPPP